MKSNKGQLGFTLIEILGVLVILGMILLIVFPVTIHLIDYYTLEAAQMKLAQDLRLAKMHALQGEEITRVSFPFGSQNYYILRMGKKGTHTSYLPEGIDFKYLSTGGDYFNPTITFGPDGVP